jgi:hypothetical protein
MTTGCHLLMKRPSNKINLEGIQYVI